MGRVPGSHPSRTSPNEKPPFGKEAGLNPQKHTDPSIRMVGISGSLRNGSYTLRAVFLHNSEQAREFLQLWETAPANPGGVTHK